MNKRKSLWLKTVTLVTVVVFFLTILILGKKMDIEQFEKPETEDLLIPYIEIVEMDEEQPLVGDVILEWLKGETSGKDLYEHYSESGAGRVYSAKLVTIQYAIHNIPSNIDVESVLVELSENSMFENSEKFELDGNKRTIQLEYLYTNRTYYFRITANMTDGTMICADSQFKTANTPRIISTEGVWNMRDIGGLKCLNGKTLKQGLVYRGVELDGAVYNKYCITEKGASVLTKKLRIKTEIDLRGEKENMRDMLGINVAHNVYDSIYAYSDSLIPVYLDNYRQLFSDLAKEESYPIYVHCSYGKDRTGTVIYLLQLLLGVSEEDAYREWELSVLLDGVIDYEPMAAFIKELKKLDGETMQEKIENHLLSIGVTKSEIENIRKILIEDYTPDKIDDEQQSSLLENKKIVYDGDSIAMGLYGEGGYAQMIANLTGSKMVNFAVGGAIGICQRRRKLPLGSG